MVNGLPSSEMTLRDSLLGGVLAGKQKYYFSNSPGMT